MKKQIAKWGVVAGCVLAANAFGQTTAPAPEAPSFPPPPASYVDADTGHKVIRLTSEANSTAPYFNLNAYTPDGKEMVYSAPDGIHMLNLATRETRLLVAGKFHPMCVGKKTATVYFTDPEAKMLCAADVATGKVTKLIPAPPRGSFVSINADETMVAGTYIEGTAGKDYGSERVNPPGMSGPLVQPLNKGKMMEERLASHLPMVLFAADLKTGKMTTLLHSTDWINHLLFSPTDPTLLMYCHEGPWQKVDRIWTIRTDGSQNTLIHKRFMAQEIAGHEFWGLDGKTIWYDLQTPKGEDFWVAAYNLETQERRWYHLQRNEWSIHFNLTADESLFCGDGGDKGQVAKAPDGKWIELFRPELFRVDGENRKEFIQPGVFRSERLVNMSGHNYKLEPNVRFSPDKSMVIFTSNMFGGASYVYGVEVNK